MYGLKTRKFGSCSLAAQLWQNKLLNRGLELKKKTTILCEKARYSEMCLPVLHHQVHGTKWGGESILCPRDTPGHFSLPYKPLHFIPLQNDVGDPSWSLQDLERLSVFPCFFLANLHPSRDEEARKIKESRRGGKRKRKCQKLIWLINCKPKRMSRNCMIDVLSERNE